MMSIQQFQIIIANALFQGDTTLQGLAMFGVILMVIFAFARDNLAVGFIALLPAAVLCQTVGILSGELALLISIVTVFAFVLMSKGALST